MHTVGGWFHLLVSLEASCVPEAVNMRRMVCPVQDAPGYSAPHRETVKVCPAPALTPQVGSLTVSPLVTLVLNIPHE